jgi:hypothetical protein
MVIAFNPDSAVIPKEAAALVVIMFTTVEVSGIWQAKTIGTSAYFGCAFVRIFLRTCA